MIEEEKTPNQEPKPATGPAPEAVDMFAGTQEAAPTAPQEDASQPQAPAAEETDSHHALSRRNMILALLALVVLLLIIGAALTYFFVFKKPSELPALPLPLGTGAPSQEQNQAPEQPQDVEGQPQTESPQAAPVSEAPLDTDQDGLSDEEETALQTDPKIPDTDSDGLTDREEANVYETSPLSADTDGDGFLDKQELDNGFNPNGEGKLPSGIPAQ
jgi:hypothetical protein